MPTKPHRPRKPTATRRPLTYTEYCRYEHLLNPNDVGEEFLLATSKPRAARAKLTVHEAVPHNPMLRIDFERGAFEFIGTHNEGEGEDRGTGISLIVLDTAALRALAETCAELADRAERAGAFDALREHGEHVARAVAEIVR